VVLRNLATLSATCSRRNANLIEAIGSVQIRMGVEFHKTHNLLVPHRRLAWPGSSAA